MLLVNQMVNMNVETIGQVLVDIRLKTVQAIGVLVEEYKNDHIMNRQNGLHLKL
jgi:hypothetical protein